MNLIRILIAEAHPVAREGMWAILQQVPDFELVENATSNRQIMTLAHWLQVKGLRQLSRPTIRTQMSRFFVFV